MTKKESNDGTYLLINTIPFSIEVTCPRCGFDIELWTDEYETICKLCGYALFTHEKTIN